MHEPALETTTEWYPYVPSQRVCITISFETHVKTLFLFSFLISLNTVATNSLCLDNSELTRYTASLIFLLLWSIDRFISLIYKLTLGPYIIQASMIFTKLCLNTTIKSAHMVPTKLTYKLQPKDLGSMLLSYYLQIGRASCRERV